MNHYIFLLKVKLKWESFKIPLKFKTNEWLLPKCQYKTNDRQMTDKVTNYKKKVSQINFFILVEKKMSAFCGEHIQGVQIVAIRRSFRILCLVNGEFYGK